MRRNWAVLFLCMGGLAFAAALTPTDVPSDGSVLPAGSATESPPGTWTLQGAGADIWGAADQFFYLYNATAVDGDFAISCHVVSLTGGDADWAKVGLMARVPEGADPEFTTSGQQYQFLCVTTTQGICHQYRDTTNGNASDTQDAAEGTRLAGFRDDVWLKLVRTGYRFEAYRGVRPGVWVATPGAHENLSLGGASMYVGIAITSHSGGNLATAVIDTINLNDVPSNPNGATDFACVLNGANVDLTWTNNAAYSSITIYRESAINGAITPLTVPSPTATSYTDSPGNGIWTYYIVPKVGTSDCLAPPSCTAGVASGNVGFVDEQGFFRSWVMLGPLGKNGGCSPALNEQLDDYLANDDLSITQENVRPAPGDDVSPDFGGNALSNDIRGWDGAVEVPNAPSGNGQNPNAATGEAEWTVYHSPTDTIDHATFYGHDPNEHMVYHVTYLTNSGAARLVHGGVSHDDAIIVMLDNSIVYFNTTCQGYGGTGVVQRRFPFYLPAGEHRVMVKVFDGGGGSGMRMRLEETDGTPITSGISLKTAPGIASVPAEQASPAGLTCVTDVNNVRLAWTNPTTWDALSVVRQNALGTFTILTGVTPTTTSLTDPIPMGNVIYFVVARKGNVASTSAFCTYKGSALIDANGYFRTWLILGPLSQAAGAEPSAIDRARDYLGTTDGKTEANVLPVAGMEMEIDFGGAAPLTTSVGGTDEDADPDVSNAGNPTANGTNPRASEGIATWIEYESGGAMIDFSGAWGRGYSYFCGYGVGYITNNTPQPLSLTIQIASDDRSLWYLDNTLLATTTYEGNQPDRGFGMWLPPGEHRLMVKVFEGGGGNNFRLRLQDTETGA